MPNLLLDRVLEVHCNLAVIFAHRFVDAVKSFFCQIQTYRRMPPPIRRTRNRSFVQTSSYANITSLLALYSFRFFRRAVRHYWGDSGTEIEVEKISISPFPN